MKKNKPKSVINKIVGTIFDSKLIGIHKGQLPDFLSNIPVGKSKKVRFRYNNGEILVDNLRAHQYNQGVTYRLKINQIIEKLQNDFYYSWSIHKSGGVLKHENESIEIIYPKNEDGFFDIKPKHTNKSFESIKSIIIDSQKFFDINLKDGLTSNNHEWFPRAKLNERKSLEGKNRPIIYYITNSDQSKYYIGQCLNGLDALKSTGLHRSHFEWKNGYFRYTVYNLDKKKKEHKDLLTRIEADHIQNFSRMSATPKVKTSSQYSIKSLYNKSGIQVEIHNKDFIDGRKKSKNI